MMNEIEFSSTMKLKVEVVAAFRNILLVLLLLLLLLLLLVSTLNRDEESVGSSHQVKSRHQLIRHYRCWNPFLRQWIAEEEGY